MVFFCFFLPRPIIRSCKGVAGGNKESKIGFFSFFQRMSSEEDKCRNHQVMQSFFFEYFLSFLNDLLFLIKMHTTNTDLIIPIVNYSKNQVFFLFFSMLLSNIMEIAQLYISPFFIALTSPTLF